MWVTNATRTQTKECQPHLVEYIRKDFDKAKGKKEEKAKTSPRRKEECGWTKERQEGCFARMMGSGGEPTEESESKCCHVRSYPMGSH